MFSPFQPLQAGWLKRSTSMTVFRWTSLQACPRQTIRGHWSCPLQSTMVSLYHHCSCLLNRRVAPHLSLYTQTCPSRLQVRGTYVCLSLKRVCVYFVLTAWQAWDVHLGQVFGLENDHIQPVSSRLVGQWHQQLATEIGRASWRERV